MGRGGGGGCCDLCLIRDACSWRCFFMSSMCVSSCRCCVLVSFVHPVSVMSAVFCIIYRLLMFVSDASGDQTYNICMTKHAHFPYTSIYSSTPHNTNRKHNIHHIPYTNTQHTSTQYFNTAATQQTFPQTPTQSLQQT